MKLKVTLLLSFFPRYICFPDIMTRSGRVGEYVGPWTCWNVSITNKLNGEGKDSCRATTSPMYLRIDTLYGYIFYICRSIDLPDWSS